MADSSGSIAAARSRIADKKKQLYAIGRIRRTIGPFIQETAGRLRSTVDQDLPILLAERHERLARPEAMISGPEISLRERFRKLMEALMVGYAAWQSNDITDSRQHFERAAGFKPQCDRALAAVRQLQHIHEGRRSFRRV